MTFSALNGDGVVEMLPREDGSRLLDDGRSLLGRVLFSNRLSRNVSLLLVASSSVRDGSGLLLVVGSLEKEVGLGCGRGLETFDSEDGEEDEEEPEPDHDPDVSSEMSVRESESRLEL